MANRVKFVVSIYIKLLLCVFVFSSPSSEDRIYLKLWESGMSGKWDFGIVGFGESGILEKWDFGKVGFEKMGFWKNEILGK